MPTDTVAADTAAPTSTSSRLTRWLGALTLASLVLLGWLGLVASPADVVQGDSVRLMYVHVPAANLMFLACGITTLASGMWLRRRTDGWDTLAHASAELGALFSALTLVTGMLWGRPTWGVYWTWDARLTSTALLFLLFLGYLTLRGLPSSPDVRARRSAVVGLLLVPNAALVHYSVSWWQTLHQEATIKTTDPTIDGLMLFTLFVGMLAGALCFGWLLVHRFRLGWLERRAEDSELDVALAERRAEAGRTAGERPADARSTAGAASMGGATTDPGSPS